MNGIGRQGQRSTAAGLQDCALYGGGGGEEGGLGSRMYRNVRRGSNAGNDFFMEPTTPPFSSLPSSQRKNGEESPSDFSPGLIDLHSFVTELLPEVVSIGFCLLVRKRPPNKKGLARNEEDIIETVSNSLVVHETKVKVDLTEYLEQHEFVFDAVLKEEVSNDEVSAYCHLIFLAYCFKLSCTYRYLSCPGSGKTYTMKPLPLKASRDILRLMHHTYRNQGFQLFVSFFEIYGGKLFDLLSDRK
ncbi:kinesin-13A-like [Gossypium australe]|uniref:Kinesin-13A-like n=1 Tax=Gossypium australe TaxID=47621 RepID=A0A5B6X8G5_9ROSI|nr:kinesin-13A-like [Gossypium australe]